MAKSWWAGKANLFPKYLFIPERRQFYLPHDGNAVSLLSRGSWSPWGLDHVEDSMLIFAVGILGTQWWP